METKQVQWLLTEWGRWRLIESGAAKGFPNQTPERRLLGGSLPTPAIEDEEAEKVDSAVRRLLTRDENQGKAIVFYYLEFMTLQKVARTMNLTYYEARGLLSRGETAVGYILDPA